MALALFYFVTFGGFVAMAIFLPKLLKDWFDYSLTDAGLRAAGFTLPRRGAAARRLARGPLGAARVLVVAFAGVVSTPPASPGRRSGPRSFRSRSSA